MTVLGNPFGGGNGWQLKGKGVMRLRKVGKLIGR